MLKQFVIERAIKGGQFCEKLINTDQKCLMPAMETAPPAKWSRLVINGIFCLGNYNSNTQIIYTSHYFPQHKIIRSSSFKSTLWNNFGPKSQCSLLFRLCKAHSSDFYHSGLKYLGGVSENILHVCYFYLREVSSTWSCL